MRKFIIFIIFFIIIVSIMTFCLTRSTEINEDNEEAIVTDTELKEYRNSLIANSKKYEHYLTEEEINQKVQEYKEMLINIAKSKAKTKGMDIKQALKISLIICSVFCLVLFVIFYLKNAQYNELLGSSFDSDNTNDNMRRLRHFFFGRWF